MKEILIQGDNLPKAYHNALFSLYEYGEESECMDWNTSQKEVSMTIEVKHPLKEPMISKLFIGGPEDLEQYTQEILEGILDFEINRGNWKYTYHDRMVNYSMVGNQIDFIVNELRKNPSSRRVVIDIRDNYKDMNSNEPACLQHIQYFIRDGKLDCKVLFRSNDACKATFMNMYALVRLQEKIANELNIEVGTYVHRANSFHCYQKDINLLNAYVKKILDCGIDDDIAKITYRYDTEWKELMDESKKDIEEKVKKLKFLNASHRKQRGRTAPNRQL